ncbi:MAG: PEGA domain-containing protein [Candidatus Shapirobacteria bacterium]|jgi:hypothetical protein
MSDHSTKKSLITILSVLFFVISGTVMISFVARGYTLNINDMKNGSVINASGLLSATSKPKGASVYIDDRLFTATDDIINLTPGDYLVKIIKDGYLPWQKQVRIKKELVVQTDAQLFRSVSDIKPLTFTGAINPSINHDGSRIVYAVASASASKDNGLYILDTISNPIPLGRNQPRQIAPNYAYLNWSDFKFTFSPNSRSILATNGKATYQIPIDSVFSPKMLVDVTYQLDQIYLDWEKQLAQINQPKLDKIPLELKELVSTESAKHISFSTSEDKLLYLAKTNRQLPQNIITPPPVQSIQKQSRDITPGNWYVYDMKEDTNFLIENSNALTNIAWIPNSDNLMYVQDNAIKVVDYDNTNQHILFNNNFNPESTTPWADGSKIVILTPSYSGGQENLYTLTIR